MNRIGLYLVQEKLFPERFKSGILVIMHIIKQGKGTKASKKNKGRSPLFEREIAFQENTFKKDLY